MSLQFELKNYRNKVNRIITSFFAERKKEFLHFPRIKKVIIDLEKFCVGGKRLRGFLTKLGYESFGKKEDEDILNFSAGVELLHSALLIHDDIIDRDDFRRSLPTLHKKYEEYYSPSLAKRVAQFSANLLFTFGFQLCLETNFSPQRKIEALSYLRQKLFYTALGEILDVHFSGKKDLSEDKIFKIYTLKTANYSFVAPFFCGLILAGVLDKKMKILESGFIKLGQAFQIKDDFLALFGKEKITGKPLGSDLKEGKMTLVLKRIKELTPISIKKKVFDYFGRESLKKEEVLKIKNLLFKTKIGKEIENEAKILVDAAKEIFLNFPLKKKKLILELADFVVKRKK